jgi:hypothetical protein
MVLDDEDCDHDSGAETEEECLEEAQLAELRKRFPHASY